MPFRLHQLRPRHARLAFGPAAAALFAACTEAPTTPSQDPTAAEGLSAPPAFAFTPISNPFTLVGAGDIAGCSTSFHDEDTRDLLFKELEDPSALVFAVGDEVYPNGTTTEFQDCYLPTWGQDSIKRRTLLPAAGNHEYNTAGAIPYFDFFNGVGVDSGVAGKRGKGYYSFNAGQFWHVVVLNSNSAVSLAAGSVQEKWLKADLALTQNAGKCVLAMMHHPRFWSYNSTTVPAMPFLPIWQDLYNAGADLVVVGHQHFYERFAPQTPVALADNTYGIRQIIIGTGGVTIVTPKFRRANSEVLNGTSFGLLRLTLGDGQYYWTFVPAGTGTFTDEPAGQAAVPCHAKPPANVKPVAGFITDGGNYTCSNLTCSFISNAAAPAERSYDPDPPTDPPAGQNGLAVFKWTFGNGRTSTSQNKTITYGAAGTYTVKLTVTDGRGATAAKSHLVTVSAGP
jgi:acid phosphatase type 7